MANCKEVDITFDLPFNWPWEMEETEQDAFLCFLAPSNGLRMTFGRSPAYSIPSKNGGITAMYSGDIRGIEAASTVWIERVLKIIERIGVLKSVYVTDIEEDEIIWNWRKD